MVQKFGIKSGTFPMGDRSEYEYLLKISVTDNLPETLLHVVVVTDRGIEMFEHETPFEHAFSATFYHIFYEGTPKRTRLIAELYSNEFGDAKKVAGTGGERGKMIRDPVASIQLAGGF